MGLSYHYVDFEEFSPKHGVGVNGELMLSNRFGVELSLNGGDGYFNYGIASLLAPPLILFDHFARKLGDDGSTVGILSLFLIIPALLEQTNFHIPVTDKIHIVTFISIYKLKYLYDTDPLNKYHYFRSGSIGTRLSLISKNNWYLSANYELSKLYKGGGYSGQLDHSVNKSGYLFGVNIGIKPKQ